MINHATWVIAWYFLLQGRLVVSCSKGQQACGAAVCYAALAWLARLRYVACWPASLYLKPFCRRPADLR